MKRLILAAAAALSLAACATTSSLPHGVGNRPPNEGIPQQNQASLPAPPVGAGTAAPDAIQAAAAKAAELDARIDLAWSLYVPLRSTSDLVLGFLRSVGMTTAAANVEIVRATVDSAFARARAASDLAVKAAELAKAAQAAAKLEELTVDPD